MRGRPVAAIDCGTNSTRLLILDEKARRLERRMTITRLGAGIDRRKRLDPAALERSLAVLGEYKELARRHGVGATRAVATSALRDAVDAERFLSPAAELLGVRPEVISGEEEGRLSFRGATASLEDPAGPFLVLDIGGGSTELILGGGGAVSSSVSLDIGCVRVTERYLSSDPPTRDELEAARRGIGEVLTAGLGPAESWRPARQLIGLAGTVSALTVMALGLDGFREERVHHARLSREAVQELGKRFASLPVAERRALRGMEEARADVILGGSLVLDEVMGYLGWEELVASEADILDGVAAELLAARGCPTPEPQPESSTHEPGASATIAR